MRYDVIFIGDEKMLAIMTVGLLKGSTVSFLNTSWPGDFK